MDWSFAIPTISDLCPARIGRMPSLGGIRVLLVRRRRGKGEQLLDPGKPANDLVRALALRVDQSLHSAPDASALRLVGRQQLRNGSDRALLVHPDQERLFPQRLFQLRHGVRPGGRLRLVHALQNSEAALVRAAVAAANVDQCTKRGFGRSAPFETRLQFSAALISLLLAELLAFRPTLIFRSLRIQTD